MTDSNEHSKRGTKQSNDLSRTWIAFTIYDEKIQREDEDARAYWYNLKMAFDQAFPGLYHQPGGQRGLIWHYIQGLRDKNLQEMLILNLPHLPSTYPDLLVEVNRMAGKLELLKLFNIPYTRQIQ